VAAELPKYKDTRTKTMQFFKGRTGKGMPEEIQQHLQKIQTAGHSRPARAPPPPAYVPPSQLAMLPLRELRRMHRTWLATADPHCTLERRPLPPPFDRHQAGAACHVLEPISPLAFTEAVGCAAAGSAEAPAGRTPELGVGRHPAAMSVVARKMLKRVQDDTAWF
jgi:hypothetical protein